MITANELALAGIAGTLLGAVVGGVLTYYAQRLSTKDTIVAQRALSHDERLWQQRVTVYGQVLSYMDRTAGAAVQLRPMIAKGEIDDVLAAEFVSRARFLYDVDGLMRLYLRPVDFDHWQEYARSVSRVRTFLDNYLEHGDGQEFDHSTMGAAIGAYLDIMISHNNELITRIRDEIQQG